MFNCELLAPIALMVLAAAGSIFIINGATPGEERKNAIRFVITFFVSLMLLVIYFMIRLILSVG